MSATVEREARIADALSRQASRVGHTRSAVVVDRVWRFFCSVRAAASEIVFLALLVLIGTLKGSIIPAQLPRFVPALEPLVTRWYAFDVFHSLVFTLTLTLLAVAIVICTINRAPGVWGAIARPTVVTTRQFFRTAEPAAALRVGEPPRAVAVELVRLLQARRYRVLSEERDGAVHIYADKHRFGRLATFPFHLALILVLVGGIVGSQFGFREPLFVVTEGATRDVGHSTGLRLELDAFVDTYDELGQPIAYRSDIALYDGSRLVRRQSVTVNHPLTYGRATIYQSGFGPAAVLRVTDQGGATIYDGSVDFTFVSKTNADAPAGILDLPAQGTRLELFFPNVKLDAKPEINGVKLRPGELYAQARDPRTNQKIGAGAVIGQRDAARLAGLNVEFIRERRFAVFQVAYNPGVPILFLAAILLVVGLIATFAFPHRRIRALLVRVGDNTSLLLAPQARRDWAGQRDFVQTMEVVERCFGPATLYGRTSDVGS